MGERNPPPPRRTLPPQGDRGEDLGEDEPVTNPRIELAAIGHPDQVDPVKVHAYIAKKREEDADAFMAKVKALAGAIAVVAGAVVAVIVFIDNRVQAQTDAGVKVHEQRISTLEQQRLSDRAETNGRLERIEKNQADDRELAIGVSKKLDALLAKERLPNPSPAPKDAGP
jgi:hypothetical protein